jgi:hypothetical protein
MELIIFLAFLVALDLVALRGSAESRRDFLRPDRHLADRQI